MYGVVVMVQNTYNSLILTAGLRKVFPTNGNIVMSEVWPTDWPAGIVLRVRVGL